MTCPSSCHEPDCRLSYRDHVLSVAISPSATPSRAWNRTPGQPDEPISATKAREARWERDLPAFKRLREGGKKAPIDGAAKVERELGG